MEKVAILGCGWLGKQLAQSLIERGTHVIGSTTSAEKVSGLKAFGVDARIMNFLATDQQQIAEFIGDSKTAVILIPPKSPEYPEMLVRIRESTRVPIIFTSSTSVYGQTSGTVTESSPVADTVLARGEKALTDATILRLAGLVGPGRHPVTSLSGRSGVAGPEAPINLIHSADVVRAIIACMDRSIRSQVINVVAPYHPSRRDYYVAQAISRGLPPPSFADDKAGGKIFRSEKFADLLGFSPDPQLLQ